MSIIKKIIGYSIGMLYIYIVGMLSSAVNNAFDGNPVILASITLISYLFLRFLTEKVKDMFRGNKNLFFYKVCGISVVFFSLVCAVLCLIELNTKEVYITILSFIMPSVSASMALSIVYSIVHLLITNIENMGNSSRL